MRFAGAHAYRTRLACRHCDSGSLNKSEAIKAFIGQSGFRVD
jgi:hypothetical protein